MSKSILHADGLQRCPWPKEDPLYIAYHDNEWGVPEFDDRALYEKLVLDGSRPAFRGSRFCASATIFAALSTTSSQRKSRATRSGRSNR
jgi:hypothetical protein